MKKLTLLALLVVTTNLLSQKQLSHTPLIDEGSYKVFPWNDGSFSVYIGSASLTGMDMNIVFKTYDSNGDLLLEKKMLDVFGISSSNNAKGKVSDLSCFYGHREQLLDQNQQQLVVIGNCKDGYMHCRTLNSKGEVKDIVYSKKLKIMGNYSLLGAKLITENKVGVCFVDHNEDLSLLTFDLENNSANEVLIEKKEKKINSFKYAGVIDSVMYCLKQNKKNELVLISINPNGAATKKILNIDNVSLGRTAFVAIPVINEAVDQLFFYVETIDSGGIVCCLKPDGSVETSYLLTEFRTTERYDNYGNSIRHSFPLFSIYTEKSSSKLLYSYNGSNLGVFNMKLTPLEIDASYTNYYKFLRIDNPFDFIGFVNLNSKELANSFNSCHELESNCLFKEFTIFNSDGTFGLLTIRGLKEDKNSFYTNVTFAKQ